VIYTKNGHRGWGGGRLHLRYNIEILWGGRGLGRVGDALLDACGQKKISARLEGKFETSYKTTVGGGGGGGGVGGGGVWWGVLGGWGGGLIIAG